MMLLASTYDQSKYFKAQDITAEKKLKIKAVTEEEIGIGKDKEKKLVVWFTNDPRGLVLNRVNNRTLRGAFGDPVSGWIGKIIIAFPTQDEFRGRMVPVIRLRIPPPKQGGNGQTAAKPPPVPPPVPAAPVELEDDDLNDEIEV
jgi:hypothetical protein